MLDFSGDDISTPAPSEGTSSDRIEDARERGRKKAVAVAVGMDDDPLAFGDGGLSLDAIKLAKSNPDLDPESVVEYDRKTQATREAERTARLSPRGDRGDGQNWDRQAEWNEAQAALREFRDYQERTD